MEMTFKVENGMLVTEATPEADAAGVREGASFVVRRTAHGFSLIPQEDAEILEIADDVMERRKNVLRELAK